MQRSPKHAKTGKTVKESLLNWRRGFGRAVRSSRRRIHGSWDHVQKQRL